MQCITFLTSFENRQTSGSPPSLAAVPGSHLQEIQTLLLQQLAQSNQAASSTIVHGIPAVASPVTMNLPPSGPPPYYQAPGIPPFAQAPLPPPNNPTWQPNPPPKASWQPPAPQPIPTFEDTKPADRPGPPFAAGSYSGNQDAWQGGPSGGRGGGPPGGSYSRDNYRGDGRGGFRGRGRGRYDGPDYSRGRDRRSRSRSPPPRGGYGPTRNARTYSPPRRPSVSNYVGGGGPSGFSGERDEVGRGNRAAPSAPGKDEFGRDIRPDASDDEEHIPRTKSPSGPAPSSKSVTPPQPTPPPAEPIAQEGGESEEAAPAPTPALVLAAVAPVGPVAQVPSVPPGLEAFNPAAFDFTSPAAWESLGQIWQVTNGYPPAQEQLMQFVMSGGQMYGGMGMQGAGFQSFSGASGNQGAEQGEVNQWDVQQLQSQSQGVGGGHGGAQGGYRGRGRGMGRGGVRNDQF